MRDYGVRARVVRPARTARAQQQREQVMHVVGSTSGDGDGADEVHAGADDLADLRLMDVPAIGSALPQARHLLTAWARDAGLNASQVDDLALAAYEAMANVVDHAYDEAGGVFDLHACRQGGLVIVTVADHGQFKPPADGGRSLRGRGLLLIERAALEFELTPLAVGTRVRMTWPVPAHR
jgi:serine/threonine-protein kinase RsbW